jgi:hypothetical protein
MHPWRPEARERGIPVWMHGEWWLTSDVFGWLSEQLGVGRDATYWVKRLGELRRSPTTRDRADALTQSFESMFGRPAMVVSSDRLVAENGNGVFLGVEQREGTAYALFRGVPATEMTLAYTLKPDGRLYLEKSGPGVSGRDHSYARQPIPPAEAFWRLRNGGARAI